MDDQTEKTLHIEMSSGVAGDMMVASLLSVFGNGMDDAEKEMLKALQSLQLPEKIKLTKTWLIKNGVRGLHIKFATPEDDWAKYSHEHGHSHSHEHSHEHGHSHNHGTHRNFSDIKKIIASSPLHNKVKEDAIRVFTLLANAEGAVHAQLPEKVHFHEVGSLDAILEIVGACFLVNLAKEKLGVCNITANHLVLGSGYVHCAHGKMPVPVPAVSLMVVQKKASFRTIGHITGELTTPTGAALVLGLATQVSSTATSGAMQAISVGYGAGKKDITHLTNILRIWLLNNINTQINIHKNNESFTGQEQIATPNGYQSDDVIEITAWVDDSSGEEIARAMQTLYANGALEVALTPITTKKSRPGTEIKILSHLENFTTLANTLVEETGTIGFRFRKSQRFILPRKHKNITLHDEQIAIKISTLPNGEKKIKIEDSSLRSLKAKVHSGEISKATMDKIIKQSTISH